MPRIHVEKSIHIAASPQRVYEVVADYRTWNLWSPWLLADPEAQVTVSPNPNSVGSTYAWSGPVTGQGQLTHKVLAPGQRIEDELQFIKPFKSTNTTSFEFISEGNGTRLTWLMDSSLPWFLFWLVPTMKTFIGMDYQRGLAMIKDQVELGSIPSKINILGVQSVDPIYMAGIASSCQVDETGPDMERSFKQAQAEFRKQGLSTESEMLSVYTKFQIKQGIFEYISGYQIPQSALSTVHAPLVTWTLPACQAFRVDHVGSYRHLGNGWSAANQIARYKKLRQARGGTFEIYRTTPPHTPEDQLLTEIYLPLR